MSVSAAGTLDVNGLDYTILAIYFAVVVAIGLLARRAIATSEDFFLSGRSLPAWVTGLAFISANLGALEILGNAANGAQYGFAAVHFYWVGAIPAMVFLGLFMMPFYYGNKVHSVPEYLRRRFNAPTHFFNALTFAVAQVLIAGVNLYALALVVKSLLGWPLWLAIIVSAGLVLVYITLGGLSGAIYTEVLQFFVILAGLIPIVVIGLHQVGGFGGLVDRVHDRTLLDTWQQSGVGHWKNPLGDWLGLVLGEGFVLSFGYWTTNFAEVQRALSAKDMSAARRTPLIGAFPKIFFPLLTIVPGMIALVTIPHFGGEGGPDYNDAIPALMGRLLPNGVLGIALTGLLAAFMAGMAANASGFNTVFTYDIWKPYVARGRSDRHYLNVGRIATVVGILISVGTAFIASGYGNIMNYIQLLFSFFNSPLFATFVLGLFWKRTTPWAGFWGLVAGTVAAAAMHFAAFHIGYFYPGGHLDPTHATINAQMANFYGAIVAFVVDVVVTVAVTAVTRPKPDRELAGLVWRLPSEGGLVEAREPRRHWWESEPLLGSGALGIALMLSIVVLFVK
ncbi:sodium:solute symporter family protein [Actinoallomurus iriomotensis]|uniref:Sodium:solute symporter n=1 Tax=Actinoallomurus iriomotensis TaxID=478107 RepID=A0A9W6SAZ7_9ACTN|nr:sodium:solute symporter family protein [Actinoallomurus iriomotensis]GLY90284.1 sodium:solute symporter [Actinoallomurus iriomotensis]